jgi:hypothetical protein
LVGSPWLESAAYRFSSTSQGHKDAIWSALFRTNRRIFHSTANYVFNYTIKTDGVSCCVVHMRRDLGNRAERRKRKRKREEERDCCEQYIDDIADARQYAGRRVVGIDPNMGNLLQCSMEDGDDNGA